MRKIKTFLMIFILLIGFCFITGCDSKKEVQEDESKTVVESLSAIFKTEIKKETDIEKVAQKISESDVIVPQVQTFQVADGDYLAGFKEEIKGFNKVVGISPMIGTIPFIAYVFEVDDAESFAKTLEDNAQLNWNICTQADEMKITTVDNYIFFVMAPKSFEE